MTKIEILNRIEELIKEKDIIEKSEYSLFENTMRPGRDRKKVEKINSELRELNKKLENNDALGI